jgi:hypothetical protein
MTEASEGSTRVLRRDPCGVSGLDDVSALAHVRDAQGYPQVGVRPDLCGDDA